MDEDRGKSRHDLRIESLKRYESEHLKCILTLFKTLRRLHGAAEL